MRLYELIDKSVVSGPGIKQSYKSQADQPGSELLGKGVFGSVYTNPNDIETAVKISKLNQGNWDADGYYKFIEKVIDLKQETHNPYLPQIYNVKRIQPTTKSDPYLIVEVEKLYPSASMSTEEAKLVFSKMIGRKITQQDIDLIQKETGVDWKTKEPKPIKWQWAIRNVMQAYIDDDDWGIWDNFKIKDPQFVEALQIVRDLVNDGYTLDLHDENYMVRKTPYGNQIVLTDPLSFKARDKIKIKSV